MINNASSEWATHAEQTNYRETPTYADTIDYCRRLAAASPAIEFRSFGNSGQGRELPLLVASESQSFTPETAKAGGKAVVLIQACIHSGEPDGKDAGFALLRDLTITKSVPSILENAVLLFIPIYNTDGHERSSPYSRINQNGPVSMGWRTTRTYQNLNRDYMKADTPETRAWLKLWNEWQPDLFIDCHVSDGADYRSNITFHYERHEGIDPEIIEWEEDVFGKKVFAATAAAGNTVSWYLEFIDNRDLPMGMKDFNGPPRFSTGYVPIRNRPGILIETHMLKDYESRVKGTYDFLRAALSEVNRDPKRLIELGRRVDGRAAERGNYAVEFELTDIATPFELKAFSYTTEHSEISDDLRVIYGEEPLNLIVPMYQTLRVTTSIVPPIAYIVPVEWSEVIEILGFHGLNTQRLTRTANIPIESYRFVDVEWPSLPFEGRHMPRFKVVTTNEAREFVAGSTVVPFNQPLARLGLNLLEPQAPDSFVRWGFFNAIFEEKEYGEPYVLEQLARDMISANPELQDEFEKALAADPRLAQNSYERLRYFYKRSPYWDPNMGLYPVGRITSALDLPVV